MAKNKKAGLDPESLKRKAMFEASQKEYGLREIRPEEVPVPGASDGVISLLEEWAADDSGYDEETLPALKENLDSNRPEYRKLFGHG